MLRQLLPPRVPFAQWPSLRMPKSLRTMRGAFLSLLLIVPALTADSLLAQSVRLDAAAVQPLAGHHPRWANAKNDAGLLPSGTPLDQLTMVLARSPQQESAFEQLLADQQNPASPSYHHWLTPEEVGKHFGPSEDAAAAVTSWLQSQGLRVNWIAPSHTFIGFSGTAADVGQAFHTEMHAYTVNGKTRISVSSDPIIPAALAIKSIRGLYTVEDKPQHSARAMSSDDPEVTTGSGANHYLGPADFNTIYDVPNGSTGAGQAIGIVGRSRSDFADFDNLRQKTGVTFADPTEIVPTAFGGVDPGPAYTTPQSSSVDLGDQLEAELDVLRAGSVAPAAKLLLVVATNGSGGIGADAQYLVQTSPVPAHVMNVSFGACELDAGSSGVNYWDNLFKQAAAEGISVFVASGDAGASGCDSYFDPPPATPEANSPNYICSSSYATCVGGTEFADTANPSEYWGTSNGPGLNSAYSYIPEGGWNEPLGSKSVPQAASSGGGVSTVIPTPSWQTGTGVPSARAGRYTPDLAFSSSGHDGYFACFAAAGASCVSASNGSFQFEYFFGTSAAAPSMAGITALLDQQTGAAQGNLNIGLYITAALSPAAFHDTTVATSGVTNCQVGTPSMCNNSAPGPTTLTGGQAGYLVTDGYDEVTGLGSLDVANFFSNYASRYTPTVTVSPSSSSITVIQPLTVAVTLNPAGNNPTPTGSVTLTGANYTSAAIVLSGGTATFNIPAGSLSSGYQSLIVDYTPDTVSAAYYSSASGSSSITVNLLNPTVTVTSSSQNVTTAQSLTVTVAVSGGSGNPTPTGTVALDGGGYGGNATLANGSATFNIAAGLLTAGSDTLTASYTPDTKGYATYNSASGSDIVTVKATAALTPVVTVTTPYSTYARAEAIPVTIAVGSGAGNPVPTGTITLVSSGYTSGPVKLNSGNASVTIPAQSLAVGYAALTAIYAPDSASAATYNNTSGSISIGILNPAKSAPIVTISPSASAITTAQTLSVFVAVAGADGYPITTGSVILSGGGYTSAAMTLVANGATFNIAAGALAAGSDTLTASYTPDALSSAIFFSASNTVAIAVSAPAPPSFTLSATSITVKPGATTANTSTVTLTPSGGFTGSVALEVAVTKSPAGATDTPTPSFAGSGNAVTLNVTGTSPVTTTVTIATTAPVAQSAVLHRNSPLPWSLAGGASLASLLLLGIPGNRLRRLRRYFAAGLLLVAFAGTTIACGGGGSSTPLPPLNPGTTPGTYTLTITALNGLTVVTSTSLTLTVQ